MIRKIIEALFWKYQEQDNWRMKMNEPIKIRKLSKEEAQRLMNRSKAKNLA
jgi:hypothetical protein